jgi:hypothetical protein
MSEQQQPHAVLYTAAEMAAKELAASYAKLREDGFGETVPGGEYINAAGERVNAHGHVLGSREAKAERAAAEEMADESDASDAVDGPSEAAMKAASKRAGRR